MCLYHSALLCYSWEWIIITKCLNNPVLFKRCLGVKFLLIHEIRPLYLRIRTPLYLTVKYSFSSCFSPFTCMYWTSLPNTVHLNEMVFNWQTEVKYCYYLIEESNFLHYTGLIKKVLSDRLGQSPAPLHIENQMDTKFYVKSTKQDCLSFAI